MLSKTKLALAVSLAWGMAPTMVCAAQTPDTEGTVTRLNEITVSSTRTERRVDKVPNTVTVTPAAKLEQQGVRDIKDLFRDEVDVTVRAAPTRFTAAGTSTGRAGNEGINIRGLEGNQVLMMVDGIRVPNSFSFGSFATGRGDFLDVDGLKTVEVLRGPASTQFGSDGLAGAVSFRTLDPSDLLKPGQSISGFARSSYAGIDRSWSNTLGVAGTTGQWQGMLLGSYRQGNEIDNKGGNHAQDVNRTTPNPVDYNNQYLLAKAFLAADPMHQIGLVFETQNRKQSTDVYSARAVPPLAANSTLDLDTRDRIDRNRVALEHRFNDLNAQWVQRAETRVYWQDAKVSQFATEDRNTAADRTRDNSYSTKVAGFSTLLESNLTGILNQRLTYGVDWSKTEITGVRDGTVAPFGETFPTKPFPDTTYTLGGAFIQSEIEVRTLSIIPGLRFDHYNLSPSSAGYVGGPTVALSGQALTPRLGVVWQLAPSFAPFGQLTQGFRAPTPDQVNNGFANLASGYTSIGNPNLKAENADSIEIGFRGKIEGVRYSVAAFDNRYRDFISQQAVSGAATPSNPTVFQYINLANAHIHGVEARAEWQMSKLWKANAGIAYSKGEREVNGVRTPLDTIQPLKAVFGVRYDEAMWGARANLVYSEGKEASQISTSTAQFAPPSYTVLDLGFNWKPSRNLSVNANLNNVFDTKYWRWSDVSGLASSSTVKDAYTAPGRNVQVSARYDF
ncbi:MAG: TonB-dependent hemoglobin/transferrin/lactoferrin family receptor [Rhodoferax sp.]|nr:TonB-dependent hemoglobin/transferrin/lactoferrin family receptor [Rhodoferax sp.]